MEQRYRVADLPLPEDIEENFMQHINDMTMVVQEYFQLRLQSWLETIGKHIFKIKQHWLKYEFAPGSGQIHAHMRAITDHKSIYRYYF